MLPGRLPVLSDFGGVDVSKTHAGSLGYQMEKALKAIFHPGRSKHLDKRYGRQRGTIYSIETMRNMSANVHQFGRFVKDNWPEVRRVEQITPGMAQAYIDELVRRERSGGWIDRVLLTLRGLASGSDGFEEWARLQVGARLHLDIPPSAWYRDLTAAPPRREVPAYWLCPSGLPWREEHPPGARFSGGHPRRWWRSWFRAKDRYRRPEPGRARLGLPGFGLWPRRFEPGPHPGRAYSPGGVPAGSGRLAKRAYEVNFQPGRG